MIYYKKPVLRKNEQSFGNIQLNTAAETGSELSFAKASKRESMEDFKMKLVRLEKNKSDLESKMREYEGKIKGSLASLLRR